MAATAHEKMPSEGRATHELQKEKRYVLDTQSLNSNMEGYSLMDQNSRHSPLALNSIFNRQRSRFQNGDLDLSKGTLKNALEVNN
jgi:hypothetical protein